MSWRRLGVPHARRVMLNATDMDGAAAVRWGLLDEAVEPAALDAAVDREIAACLRCAPGAVADCKRLIEFVSTHGTSEEYSLHCQPIGRPVGERGAGRGDRGVFGKRKPAWQVELNKSSHQTGPHVQSCEPASSGWSAYADCNPAGRGILLKVERTGPRNGSKF